MLRPRARIPCHPLDTCKAKLQVGWRSSGGGSGLRALLGHLLRTEGLRGLYRGMGTPTDGCSEPPRPAPPNHRPLTSSHPGFGAAFVGSCPAGCVYFTTYEMAKRKLSSFAGSSHADGSTGGASFVVHFSAGLLAEVVSCVFWVPTGARQFLADSWELLSRARASASAYIDRADVHADVVKERLQVQAGRAGTSGHAPYRGSLDAARTILREEGLRGTDALS